MILVLTTLNTLSETLSLHHLQQTDGTRLFLILHSPATEISDMMVYYTHYTSIEIVHNIFLSYCQSSYNEGVKPQVTDVPSNTCNIYVTIFP